MAIVRKHFEWTPWSELLLMLPGRSPQYSRNHGRKFELTRKVEQVHSEATREKIGAAMVGKPSRFAGHTHTERTKAKMRDAKRAETKKSKGQKNGVCAKHYKTVQNK